MKTWCWPLGTSRMRRHWRRSWTASPPPHRSPTRSPQPTSSCWPSGWTSSESWLPRSGVSSTARSSSIRRIPSVSTTTASPSARFPRERPPGSVIAGLLPPGAHYVKAFGTLGAPLLADEAYRSPRRTVLFYATDDDVAAAAAERLITAAGFDPVKAGGVEVAARLEVPGGDLNGQVLGLDDAPRLSRLDDVGERSRPGPGGAGTSTPRRRLTSSEQRWDDDRVGNWHPERSGHTPASG